MGDNLLFYVGVGVYPIVPDADPDSTIEHTSYLFASSDGYAYNSEEKFIQGWNVSDLDYFTPIAVESIAAGDVWEATPLKFFPEIPSGGGFDYTGESRGHLYVSSSADSSGGDAGNQDSISDIHLGYSTDLISGTVYYVYEGNTYPGVVMHGRELWPDNFHESASSNWYWDSGDIAGEWVLLKVDAYAYGAGGRTCNTAFSSAYLTTQAEVNLGGGDWDGTRNVNEGSFAFSGLEKSERCMTALYDGDNPPGTKHFKMGRAFFTFDFGEFSTLSSGTRDLKSCSLNITGYSYGQGNIVGLQGTQSDSLTAADFDAFTGSAITNVVDWQTSNNNNVFTFNTTGSGYISTQMTGNDKSKFCLREYDHDYLDVAPTIGNDRDSYLNGCYFAARDDQADISYVPKLIVTYDKLSEYLEASAENKWTATTGRWNGSSWSSSGSNMTLKVAGSWEVGERWVGIKLTFTGTANLTSTVKDNNTGKLVDAETITSKQVVTLYWNKAPDRPLGDLDLITLSSSGDRFTLLRIDLLEQ